MKGVRVRILSFKSTQPFGSSKEHSNNTVVSNGRDPEIFSCKIHQNPQSCKEQEHSTARSDEEFEQRLRSRTKGHAAPNSNGIPIRDVIDVGGSCAAPPPHEDDAVFEDCEAETEAGRYQNDFLGFHPSPETQFCRSSSSMKKITEGREEYGQQLVDLESKCPPGGSDSVILYTTSLRGIRKTFEDCRSIKFLLDSFDIIYYERDVSMHLEFRKELRRILGGKVIPPRLFIRGRHIGGADEVVELHEHGKLKNLFRGIPLDLFKRKKCIGCAGVSFVLCTDCSGSRKVFNGEGKGGELFSRCPLCNENGLIKCPICC